MGLDSNLFVISCWVLAALLFTGSVFLAVRTRRRSIGDLLVQIFSHLLVVVSAVLAVAATLNVQYDWYASWSDLGNDVFGQTPAATVQQTGATKRPVQSPQAQDVDRAANERYDAARATYERTLKLVRHPGEGGQAFTVQIPGQGEGKSGTVTIWLPPSYTDPAQAKRIYPVIEAYHGLPGSDRTWLKAGKLGDTMGRLIAGREISPTIVVLPNILPGGVDTECIDSGRYQMETWLTKTIPDWVIAHLRVHADTSGWATMGYSLGGWCSAMSGILHPDRYAATIILGGYFQPLFYKYVPFSKVPERYDLLPGIEKSPPDIAVWIEVSGSDRISGPPSEQFVRAARAPMSVTSVTYADAGHRFSVWMDIYPQSLVWLGSTLPAFSPAVADVAGARG